MDALLITTIGHIVSSLIFVFFGILIFLHNRKKTLNRAFALSSVCTGIFGISLAIGINLPPGPLAYAVWMVNIIDVVIVSTFFHFSIAALGVEKEPRIQLLIRAVYGVGALIMAGALLFPHLFLPEILPKLFTKSYLEAGPLYYAMFAYFSVVFFTAFVSLIRGWFTQKEKRKTLEYFIFAAILGYGVAPIDFFLVFNIPVSPMYGMFFAAYIIPIAYGILSDELLDIRVVLKRALVYSVGIAVLTALFTALIFLNDVLVSSVPWVRFWTIPIFTAVVSFVIGRLFWFKLIENDRVKYEFVTVATHKLRTPLTQISWGIRQLLEQKDLSPEARDAIDHIQHSSNRLIELTNILFETTEEGSSEYTYTKEPFDLLAITHTILERLHPLIEKKNLHVNVHADEPVMVRADERRITSVIEVFMENAISYTPEGGLIQIITYPKGRSALYSVRDSGIGVSASEKKNIFSRFYRTDAAKRADTEGVGLGLAMAKNIIEKHKGNIGVDSPGENKGSVFWFSIPRE